MINILLGLIICAALQSTEIHCGNAFCKVLIAINRFIAIYQQKKIRKIRQIYISLDYI